MWLNRSLLDGPYLALCKSQKQFDKVLKHIGIDKATACPFVNAGADGTTHTFEAKDGGLVCIVCLNVDESKTLNQIHGLLVHEAVHVWQNFTASIGESNPSWEFEAYSIQGIAQRLFEAYENAK